MDSFTYKKFLICKTSEDKLIRIKLRKQLFAFASEEDDGDDDSENSDVPSVEELAAKPIPSNDVSEGLEFLSNISDNPEYWEAELGQRHIRNKFYLNEEDRLHEGSDKEAVRPAKPKNASYAFLKNLKNSKRQR